ncbi:hypothetical protein J6590_058190 [Homalodisca vitripennis]|nr:hypothetical protein J6590_058190 [Homalodisca vitripennis]
MFVPYFYTRDITNFPKAGKSSRRVVTLEARPTRLREAQNALYRHCDVSYHTSTSALFSSVSDEIALSPPSHSKLSGKLVQRMCLHCQLHDRKQKRKGFK